MNIEGEQRSIAEAMLSALQTGAQTSLDLLGIFLTTRYKGVRLLKKSSLVIKTDFVELHRRQQQFYTRMNQLKRDGLISVEKKQSGTLWRITPTGKDRLSLLARGHGPRYQKISSGKVVIVSYDIPQSKNAARKWIREILKMLDYTMLHKSVWIGRHAIPKELLEDLRKREIFECTHIFEVGGQGTLKKIQ